MAKDTNSMIPAEAFPPGFFIKEEIEAREWSQADLAAILGRPLQMVNELIAGKRGITPDTARALAEAFGTDAAYWMKLDAIYQLWRAKQPDKAIARRARVYSKGPIKEMARRGWIDESPNIDILEREVVRFFDLDSIEDDPKFLCAARRSTSYTEKLSGAQCAWLFRARQIAKSVGTSTYSPTRLKDGLSALRRLMDTTKALEQIPKTLASVGIRFVLVEALAHTKIDGATFWLNATSPVIALSVRYDRLDWFWFTLEHELGHIHHRDGLKGTTPTAPLLDVELVGTDKRAARELPPDEQLANAFAAEQMIPEGTLASFIARTRPLYSKKRLLAFAGELGVHPALLVGQLQHRGEISYAHSREMLERVRHLITAVAPTDGWGHRPSIPT